MNRIKGTYIKFYYYFLFILILIGINISNAQNLNFRVSSFFYSFERYDSLSPSGEKYSRKFLKGYQNLLLDITKKDWSFNTNFQTEEDVIGKTGKGFNYRFYSVFIKRNNIFNLIDLKVGRQYVSAGTGRGTIDGLFLKLKLGKEKEYQLKSYIGANTPFSYDFSNYGKLSENYSFGAQFSYYGVKDLSLSLSYFVKRSKPESYYTIRPDSIFNPKELLIDIDEFDSKLTGIDLVYDKKYLSFFSKLYYDINLKRFYRCEVNLSYNIFKTLRLNVGYNYREPQISYNTIFWVFNHKQTQELEGGVDFILKKKFNIYARISNVFYNDDNSLKISIGFLHPSYGISVIKHTGYSGESEGIYGYFNYEIINKKLSLTSGLNFSSYKLDNYLNSRETAIAGIIGFVYRPINKLNLNMQGQFIKNRIYKFDTRILVGISYWLFTKL